METNNEKKLPINKLDELNDEQMFSVKGGYCDHENKEVDEGAGGGCGCGCGCGC